MDKKNLAWRKKLFSPKLIFMLDLLRSDFPVACLIWDAKLIVKPLAKQIFIANIMLRRARNIKETQQGN